MQPSGDVWTQTGGRSGEEDGLAAEVPHGRRILATSIRTIGANRMVADNLNDLL
jgi:hypothetical protein